MHNPFDREDDVPSQLWVSPKIHSLSRQARQRVPDHKKNSYIFGVTLRSSIAEKEIEK
jgi:hypothetical protein